MYLYVMSYECLVVTQMERCENAVVTLRALEKGRGFNQRKGWKRRGKRVGGNYTPAFELFPVRAVLNFADHEGC